MKATRDAFGEQLAECAKTNPDIIAINADLGKATKLSVLQGLYPNRVIDVGIAENNMIGIASGLAEHGYKVFIASFASFLTGKYDTIRCSISYPNVPVVIVGSHGGLAIGKDGVTQMGLEDLSLMRSLPGMTVLNPATPNETKAMVKWLCETELTGPVYLRIARQPVEELYENYGKFTPGLYNQVGKFPVTSSNTLVLTSGCILDNVLKSVEGLPVIVYNMPTLKPWNMAYGTYTNIITIEDHSIIGGLGTCVAEDLARLGTGQKLTKIGLNDEFPESAPPEDLYEKYGLSVNKIRAKIIDVINENK
jgi:transketolase